MLDYVFFLVPTDGIQLLFLLVIAGLSVGTAIWVHLSTREKTGTWTSNWERNWEGDSKNKPIDDFNIEHGSVFELSEAIATPAEKFASVLPSMLLVIGLLGTFLGVGFSLDAAAGILGNKGEEPMVLLQKMMPMLDGMGALFKSSIYGIIFFFLFSAWRSKFGTDGKRLKYCITKCNELLATKKSEETKPIIESLNNVSNSLGDSLQDVLIKVLNEGMRHIGESLQMVNKSLGESMQETISKGFKSANDDLKKVADSLNNLNEKMEESFKSVETSAKKMGDASSSLKKSVENFTPAVQKTLGEIQDEFVASIEKSGKIMDDAGGNIQKAVNEMAKETAAGQGNLNKTLSDFQSKLENFQSSLTQMMAQISRVTTKIGEMSKVSAAAIKQIGEDIRERMSDISGANFQIDKTLKNFPLDEVRMFLNISLKKLKPSDFPKVDK